MAALGCVDGELFKTGHMFGRHLPARDRLQRRCAARRIGVRGEEMDAPALDAEIHPYDESCTDVQIERLQAVRANRDTGRVQQLLGELVDQARSDDINLLPKTLELVKARATLGEICAALRGLWGAYDEPMIV